MRGGSGGPPWTRGGSGRPSWTRGGGGSARRPPWWPEDEPFPPADREAWRRNAPRSFRRRIGFVFLAFFLILFLTSAVAVAVLTDVFGVRPHHGLVPLAALFGVLILAGFFAFVRWLRRMAAPVEDVMAAADRVAGGDYTVRIAERGPGEMRRLARSFNEMTERLRSDEERRRALLADVAHELRTPLSVIQGNAEGMIDGLYPADRAHLTAVLEETKVMARLLQDLQTLSTAEAGALVLHREPTTAARLADGAVAAFAGPAGEKGVALGTDVALGLPELQVDPFRIGEVLTNLLSNALRHTPSGGSVTLSAGPDRDAVAFEVRDTGPGIPPDQLPQVFDRYVKAADTGGSGLGLAIAKTIVEAHGGWIEAANGTGGGAVIRFGLPSVPPPR
jgi:signal transduction histidine kinase